MTRSFLVGCGRSGTTFVAASLGMHPEIFVMPETVFFRNVAGMPWLRGPNRRAASFRRRTVGVAHAALLRIGIGSIPVSAATARLRQIGEHLSIPTLATCELPRTRDLTQLTQQFMSLIDEAAQSRSCRAWIDQSPIHLRYIDYIERYVPEARVIHVVRNGCAVIASLWDATQKYEIWRRMFPTVESCIETWNTDIACSKKHLGRSNHFHINYHRFAADVQQGVRATAEFLGVDPTVCLAPERDASRVALPEHTWLMNVGGSVRDDGLKKFHSLFSEEEQARISSALAEGGNVDWCP